MQLKNLQMLIAVTLFILLLSSSGVCVRACKLVKSFSCEEDGITYNELIRSVHRTRVIAWRSKIQASALLLYLCSEALRSHCAEYHSAISTYNHYYVVYTFYTYNVLTNVLLPLCYLTHITQRSVDVAFI